MQSTLAQWKCYGKGDFCFGGSLLGIYFKTIIKERFSKKARSVDRIL